MPKAAVSSMVCSVWPVVASILSSLPGLVLSPTHRLPAALTATSPSEVPATFSRTEFSANAAELPPAVVTTTLPSPCTGSASRLR